MSPGSFVVFEKTKNVPSNQKEYFLNEIYTWCIAIPLRYNDRGEVQIPVTTIFHASDDSQMVGSLK